MALVFPGGTIRNQTFTATTRREIVDGIVGELASAGWSYVSGSGTADVKMVSATDAQGKAIRVRVYDPGSGVGARVRILNVSETVAVAWDAFLLPAASRNLRIIACKYQFCVLLPGSTREFLFVSSPYTGMTPASSITAFGIMQSSAAGDNDGAIRNTWRNGMSSSSGDAIASNGVTILNATGFQNVGGATAPTGIQKLPNYVDSDLRPSSQYRWHNGDYFLGDAIVFTGTTASSEEGKARGQLWGAFVDSCDRTMDTTFSFDDGNGSKDYMVITSSNTGTVRGTLCLQIT